MIAFTDSLVLIMRILAAIVFSTSAWMMGVLLDRYIAKRQGQHEGKILVGTRMLGQGIKIEPTGKELLFGVTALASVSAYAAYATHQMALVEHSTRARVVFGSSLVLLSSIALFILKVRAIRFYAAIEILFAAATCYRTLLSIGDVAEPWQIFGIGGSVYLFVRGFDNYKKGSDDAGTKKP